MSTYDVINEAVRMYEAGASVRDIAEELQRSKSTIYAMLQDGGVEIRRAERPLTDFLDPGLIKQVAGDYAKGITVAKIARTSSLSQHTIYKILEEEGVPLRSSASERKRVDERVVRAIEMYKNGDKLIKIEMETGVASTQLYKALYRENIPLRSEMK